MSRSLPQLSRFELQVLRLLWDRSEASVSDLHSDIADAPSYSTIRKIVEQQPNDPFPRYGLAMELAPSLLVPGRPDDAGPM